MVIPKSSLQFLLSLFYLWLTLAEGPNVSAQTVKPYTFEEHHMGTLFKITLYAESDSVAELAASNAFQEIERLNNIMSDYLPESELNQFSQTSGSGKFVRLSEPLFEILSQAQWISYQTGGLFDVTVGAMSKAWRELRSQPVPVLPAPEDLDALIRRSGYRHLVLRHDTQSGMLKKPGMELDLGGIAKGYASARALETVQSFGISSALIDAGGDITAGNPPPGRTSWSVAVPKPAPAAGGIDLVRLQVNNATVATSGGLFQYIEIDGKRYSHILHPETGLGADQQIQATVIGSSATKTDALASALTLMDPEEGLRLIGHIPDTEAILFKLVDGEIKEWRSPGADRFLSE